MNTGRAGLKVRSGSVTTARLGGARRAREVGAARSPHLEGEPPDDVGARGQSARRMARPCRRAGKRLAVGHGSSKTPDTPAFGAALTLKRVERRSQAAAGTTVCKPSVAVVHASRGRSHRVRLGRVGMPRLGEHTGGMMTGDGDGIAVVLAAISWRHHDRRAARRSLRGSRRQGRRRRHRHGRGGPIPATADGERRQDQSAQHTQGSHHLICVTSKPGPEVRAGQIHAGWAVRRSGSPRARA